MRKMRGAILMTCLAGLLALPAGAGAVTLTPPGKAGTDQYYEDVPSARGPAAPPAGASSSPSTGASARSIDALGGRRAIARLNRMGKAGHAAASLAAASASATVGRGGRGASGGGPTAVPSVSGSSVSGLAAALGGDTGGLGLLLPLLLVGTVLAALLVAAARLRGRSGPVH